MAITSDLTFGHGIDDKLHKILDEMPDAFQDDMVAAAAALLTLDEMFGLRRDNDYILVTPGYIGWLMMMVTPIDLKLNAAIEEDDEATLDRLMVKHPFEVNFSSPEGDVFTEMYPKIVRGKRLRLRCMNEDQARELDAMCTVHADGTLIYLPPSGRPLNIYDV